MVSPHLTLLSRFQHPRASALAAHAFGLLAPGAVEDVADPYRWLFLDTETTGLSGGTGTYAFMVGIAWWAEDCGFAVEQLFMRNHAEEPSLLLDLARRFSERTVLVTFNGKSFDWPLLETRYRMARIRPIPSPRIHLDLLHPARQLWRLQLRSVALTELERHVLGLDRGYDIPSETIPSRYFDYLRGGPPEPIAEIFHHNQMDLCGLAALAVRISGLLREPEKSTGRATELYGISRLLQRRGKAELAEGVYERALSAGLPDCARRTAKRELALSAKRRREFARANLFWEELLDASSEGLKAYEHLAIYYEHQARDPERAAGLARDALVKLREAMQAARIAPPHYRRWHARLQRRLDRLNGKLGKAPSWP